MLTYDDIFKRLVKSAYDGEMPKEIEKIKEAGGSEKYIYYAAGGGEPSKVVYTAKDCVDIGCTEEKCQVACLLEGISRDGQGNVVIPKDCVGCGLCVDACQQGCLIDRKEFIPLVNILRDRKAPVFAIVAPAIVGQFGKDVTLGKLRTALKRLGFYGMVEVALFADILTLKEALEFDRYVQTENDFVLTSCCCPMWVAMIRKVYKSLVTHISPSVSPMVACGRGIKKLHPDAKVVFIGPCIAKKAEAKEIDVQDAVDVVITFKELAQIFEALKIEPAQLEEDNREHSSRAGRVYARTGGVSEAVASTLERIRPEKPQKIRALQAEGVPACKALLKDALAGNIKANFYEGMGCIGGCVGGPHANIDKEEGHKYVNQYGDDAQGYTPADNKHVLALLKSLGYENINELIEGEKADLFKRDFS